MNKVNYPIIFTLLSTIFILLSQTLSFNPNTGDKKFDNKLSEINVKASNDINAFIDRVHKIYNIEKNQVQNLLEEMEPADVLMAMQINYITENSLSDVLYTYKERKKAGWKFILNDLGIKSSSYEYVELKKIKQFNDVSFITNTLSQNKN